MVDSTHSQSAIRIRWMLVLALVLLTTMVLKPVIEGIIWGIVVAILLSPIHDRVLSQFPQAENFSTLILLVGAFGMTGAPLIWGIGELQSEVRVAYSDIRMALSSNDLNVLDQVSQIPRVGAWLRDRVESFSQDADSWLFGLKDLIPMVGRGVGALLRDFGTKIFLFALIFITSFFLLRDGKRVLRAAHPGLLEIVGSGLNAYLVLIRSAVFAVSVGILGTAMVQGIVAMIGYALIGLETPLLLGLLSAVTSLIPIFGASLVWGPIVVGLILDQREMAALALSAWGILVVHPTDNFLRPLLISHLMDYPFFLILLGIVGGLLSFGVVGIFLGPAILGAALQTWSQWITSHSIEKNY